ncbi:MAG TPA: type II toxin-antitoxin system death-on-curing family toxin [Anaerolineae bacterium]|nr:type II toxin-antitoxin system death-on-curing family toxin [Anaerolineae bacterium]
MDELGPEIAYPTLEQIVEINRRMIETSGGSFTPPDNLRNRDSLEYVLIAIRFPVFDHDLFATIKHKAAALSYEIIKSHVFFDGNKRTASHVSFMFLRSNNVPIFLDKSIEVIAIEVASGSADRNDFLSWLHEHQAIHLK